MSKLIDYPRASFKNCLQLAVAVDDLGGKCRSEMAAEKLNKKISGAFHALVASTVRFGLITSAKGQLENTGLYRDHKLAYTKEDADVALTLAFLSPPLFRNIFDRFEGRNLPVEHFEKLLIKEFKVPENFSSRVAKYFLEGAKQCALLGDGNELKANAPKNFDDTDEDSDDVAVDNEETGNGDVKSGSISQETIESDGRFSVRIKGPGMDSVIVIDEEDDLLIVNAMLKKVAKRLVDEIDE